MEAARAYRAAPLPSERYDEDAEHQAVPLGGFDPGFFAAENRVATERLLRALAPRERLLIELHFYDNMSQRQVAQRLGISQMHVSRLMIRSLARLRQLVDDPEALLAPPDEPRRGR